MEKAPLPPSLWAATARPAPETPPLTEAVTADVCIVGGGFCGLSAALHAAEGGAKVVLLEASEPGFGASGRNGGQVVPGVKWDPEEMVAAFGPERGEAMADFAGKTVDVVFGLIEKHSIQCDAVRSGWIQGIHTGKHQPIIEARAKQWQARGAEVTILDKAETERITGAAGYIGAFFDKRGGTVNPLGYARGLAEAAIAAGASLHGASAATAMRQVRDGWLVETARGQVTAKQVLLCTNGYTDGLWPGLQRSVVPLYSFIVATKPLSDNVRRSILPGGQSLSETRRVLTYSRLDAAGRLVVGGRGGFHESQDIVDYKDVIAGLQARFPQVEEQTFEYFWGGRVAMTASHLPHFDELAPGVTAALGFNGRGVAMASATGKLLAERALGTPLEQLPLPARPIKPIPFHGLRRPVLRAMIGFKRWQDRREAATG